MKSWLSQENDPSGVELEKHEALLRDLYNQMIRVAYSRVRNKSDAHDVVQEAWVNMLAKRDSLREQSKLAAWAKTITANVAHNVNRRYAGGRAHCALSEEQEESGSPSPTEAELMLEISELLGALDPRSRTMILYKFYYGFKDQEIADAMNMPLGTVKARIHRSKQRLKQSATAANDG
ncbi:RNA polymerase sigma factor [Paenibacillus sp. IB182496]|uniref:RNA polymerase sigma factor n=1 Tax=Paenibacillus sabuli TaxID=2772509 RepID=A0A927BT05_9BACL|nr:RNA polymerase sigma factor [Paenibacillus sabuli]MBD2845752.1 RNA polymerase sigma factor [Paenibacillus sabuli]